MARNWDEPFGLYGLLAEIDRDRAEWRVGGVHPAAGGAVLRRQPGHRRGRDLVDGDAVGERAAKVSRMPGKRWRGSSRPASARCGSPSPSADSELPLIIGLRPILKKADWEGVDFAASSLRVPVGSGPYVDRRVRAGAVHRASSATRTTGGGTCRSTAGVQQLRHRPLRVLRRRGRAVPGLHRRGRCRSIASSSPTRWASDYDFPAVTSGEVVKAEIPHGRPSGMEGFVFNTRRPIFQDWRVRDALLHAFNYEFVNQTLNAGRACRGGRATSPTPSSAWATGRRRGGWRSCSRRSRGSWCRVRSTPTRCRSRTARRATARTCGRRRSGWRRRAGRCEGGVLQERRGRALRLRDPAAAGAERGGDQHLRRRAAPARDRRRGSQLVDEAQYNARRSDYDYDMIVNPGTCRCRPGTSRRSTGARGGVTTPGTRNYMGVDSPAAEAMIADMLATRDPAEFVAAVQALDRVLTTGRYVIPFGFSGPELRRLRRGARLSRACCRSTATGSAGCRRCGGASRDAARSCPAFGRHGGSSGRSIFEARGWRGLGRAAGLAVDPGADRGGVGGPQRRGGGAGADLDADAAEREGGGDGVLVGGVVAEHHRAAAGEGRLAQRGGGGRRPCGRRRASPRRPSCRPGGRGRERRRRRRRRRRGRRASAAGAAR